MVVFWIFYETIMLDDISTVELFNEGGEDVANCPRFGRGWHKIAPLGDTFYQPHCGMR